ncbi:hypothetical protein [Aeromonas rivipollensis]|uniref:hypothetical protein n=1 Tax=Aeromonas rivipollensis TaxID=948519 RepID=UPI0013312A2B|nr:hypothetical protein [Aeromonas rivipollensis]
MPRRQRDGHRRHRCRRQLQHHRDLSGLADGNLTVVASVTDAAGNRASATDDTSLLDTTAHITVSLDDVNAANVADAPIGGTSDVGANRTVTLVITDAKGASVTVTAVTDADGNYNHRDLSGLADGNLTVVAASPTRRATGPAPPTTPACWTPPPTSR